MRYIGIIYYNQYPTFMYISCINNGCYLQGKNLSDEIIEQRISYQMVLIYLYIYTHWCHRIFNKEIIHAFLEITIKV